MPVFHQRISKKIRSFEVTVYEVDTSVEDEAKKLENYLVDRIKKIKIFNEIDELLSLFNVPNIDDTFSKKFKENLKEICNPKKNKIATFDIRRSFVTEFMSQLLLERNYSCMFYDHADKRINVTPITIEKHSPGIDVVGVRVTTENIKFVVCEVKASKSDIPCTETKSLLEDINNAKNISNHRLTKEILSYIDSIKSDADDLIIAKIVQFLLTILAKKEDEAFVLSNIIFFPFLLRNNNEIVSSQNVDDFELFSNEDFNGIEIKGVIWSFNNDINTFCENIWNQALENA